VKGSFKMWTHPIKAILQKLKPFLGEKADLLWIRYQTAEKMEKPDWERNINLLAQKYGVDTVEDMIVLPPPLPGISAGDLNIGKTKYLDHAPADFGLHFSELTRHMGIFGSTGSGKTSLAKNILRQLIYKNIPFIVFDWERNYRDLISEHPNLKVFTVGTNVMPFYFNYLAVPPGLTYQEYIKSVVDVFNRAYVGGVGSDSVLLKVFDKAYQDADIPTTKEAHEIMDKEMKGKLKGREMLWKQSTKRMFDFLEYGGTGDMLSVRENYPVKALFEDFIVFELGGLASPYDKRFFIEMFTLWYWLHKEHDGIQHESLKHVLVFEEFHNIVEGSEKEDLIQKIFRQIRKYGTGLIIIDQTPSLIPNPIFENLYAKITFTLNHWSNVRSVADAMFMGPEERRFIGMLKTGQAICRLSARHTMPFLLDIPFIGEGPQVADEDLKAHMARFSVFSSVKPAPAGERSTIRSFQKQESLTPLAKILLADIGTDPFMAISIRYKKLGLGAAQGTDIQKELLEKAYVNPITLDGKKFLEITDKAKTTLESYDIHPSTGHGRGGFEHAYYVNEIKNLLVDAGGFAFIEQDDIDVVGYRIKVDGEHTVAVQVETGKSDIKKNLVTLANYKADERYMVATNKAGEAKIAALFIKTDPSIQGLITVLPAKAFLKNYSLKS
jgi:hypothetical protein